MNTKILKNVTSSQLMKPFRPSSLYTHSQLELDRLFHTLPALNDGELSGVYRGRLFAVVGLGLLPKIIRSLLYQVLQTFINPWKGKRFDAKSGANIWFFKKGYVSYGYYDIETKESPVDQKNVTYLSYDVEKNIGILRGVRGEVRKLSEDVYLARMNYQTKNSLVRVLYFTLTRH